MSEVLARSRAVVEGARAAIDAARERINDQNVYPVPDGDTGTNLALTVARHLRRPGRLPTRPSRPRWRRWCGARR